MTAALWILLCIALLLVAFNLLRVGVDAAYEDGIVSLRLKAGPVHLTILPKKPKPEKPKKKKKKNEGAATGAKKSRKRIVSLSEILHLARLALEAVGAFRRKLQVDLLRLHLRVGTEDPYNTAMTYAYLRAAIGGLAPLAERTLTIRERDVQLGADFSDPGVSGTARLILTIRIGQIVAIALVFLWKARSTLLEILKKNKKSKSEARKARAERTVSNGE